MDNNTKAVAENTKFLKTLAVKIDGHLPKRKTPSKPKVKRNPPKKTSSTSTAKKMKVETKVPVITPGFPKTPLTIVPSSTVISAVS